MLNIIPFPETHKPKGDGQQNPAHLGPADFSLIPPVGANCASIVANLTFRRRVKQLHVQGPRVLAELLAEVAVRYSLGGPLNKLLDRYLRIPDEALDVTNGHDLPPVPVYDVSQLLRSAS